MNRYQIYLDPDNVASVDDLAARLDWTRSKVIRDAASRIVREYLKALTVVKSFNSKNHPLLKMSGAIKGASPDLSSRVDEIYLRD